MYQRFGVTVVGVWIFEAFEIMLASNLATVHMYLTLAHEGIRIMTKSPCRGSRSTAFGLRLP